MFRLISPIRARLFKDYQEEGAISFNMKTLVHPFFSISFFSVTWLKISAHRDDKRKTRPLQPFFVPSSQEIEQQCHVLLYSEAPDECWFLLACRMPYFLPIENRTKEENEHESDCC
jgi:hypothetical protein